MHEGKLIGKHNSNEVRFGLIKIHTFLGELRYWQNSRSLLE